MSLVERYVTTLCTHIDVDQILCKWLLVGPDLMVFLVRPHILPVTC